MAERPAFLVTIDTEGDGLWSREATVTTRNAGYLPRFQALCEKHGLRPTYLTDWEMVESAEFREFAGSVLPRGTAEVGMHLHAWNTPPLRPLTANDARHHPFLIEYPVETIREKVRTMTDALEQAFGTKVTSHRAGRWMLDATYARVLAEAGYLVDCSVTPHTTWRNVRGAPGGKGPVDFSRFPEDPYFVHLDAIDRPGSSPLLEVPVTIRPLRHPAVLERLRGRLGETTMARRIVERLWPRTRWMRPNGRNGKGLVAMLGDARRERRDHVEFILHSSELMPGGSPTFRTSASVEALYRDLDRLFASAASAFDGLSLHDYYRRLAARVGPPIPPGGSV